MHNNAYLRSLLAGLSCEPPHITALISFEAALLYLIKVVICSKLVSGVFECLPSRWRVFCALLSLPFRLFLTDSCIIKGRLRKNCVQQPDNLKSFEVFAAPFCGFSFRTEHDVTFFCCMKIFYFFVRHHLKSHEAV